MHTLQRPSLGLQPSLNLPKPIHPPHPQTLPDARPPKKRSKVNRLAILLPGPRQAPMPVLLEAPARRDTRRLDAVASHEGDEVVELCVEGGAPLVRGVEIEGQQLDDGGGVEGCCDGVLLLRGRGDQDVVVAWFCGDDGHEFLDEGGEVWSRSEGYVGVDAFPVWVDG